MKNKKIYSRRSALRFIGMSSAGIAVATAAASLGGNKEELDSKTEETQAQLADLREKYEKLDRKQRMLIKALFFVTGINFFI